MDRFLQEERGADTDLLDRALEGKHVVMVPVVLAELLGDRKLAPDVRDTLSALPLVEVRDGLWSRAGALWAEVLAKARLGDALIAQFCVDHKLALITRDRDFHAFADAAKLGSGPIRRGFAQFHIYPNTI